MTIPNLLTLLRLALLPVIAVLAYSPDCSGRAWALGVFIFAMATDAADGIIAKHVEGQSSRLGLYLDPVVDKAVLLTMLFVFADLELLPLWMAILFMVREFVVAGLRSAAASSGQVVGANLMGKTKASLQTVCIGLGLGARAFAVEHSAARLWVTAFAGFTLFVALIFAAAFVWRNRSLFGQRGE